MKTNTISLTRSAAQERLSEVPPANLCECHGCRQHITRLEEIIRQLVEENDRLHGELEGEARAA